MLGHSHSSGQAPGGQGGGTILVPKGMHAASLAGPSALWSPRLWSPPCYPFYPLFFLQRPVIDSSLAAVDLSKRLIRWDVSTFSCHPSCDRWQYGSSKAHIGNHDSFLLDSLQSVLHHPSNAAYQKTFSRKFIWPSEREQAMASDLPHLNGPLFRLV